MRPSRAPAGPWPSRGGRRRARRWQVPPLLGVHSFAPDPGVADRRERLRLLRKGDPVPADHRPAAGLLPDRDARRRAQDPGEGHGQALVARSRARTFAAGAPGPPRRPGRGSPVATARPSQRRQRTLDGVKRVLLREAQIQPLLVLEDLHWIDGETQAFLDSLVESLPSCPCYYSSTTGPSISTAGEARRTTAAPDRPSSARERRRAARGPLGRGPGLEPLRDA